MLENSNATANLAVKDLEKAKAFYEKTLGLSQVDDMDGELIVYKSGDTLINVYHSQFAGTNKATAASWAVGDQIGVIVKSLRSKGVTFEHYDEPDLKTDAKGIARGGDNRGPTIAWFKDPAGNILSVVESRQPT